VTPTFEAYLASLTGLSVHADPTLATTYSEEIREAAASLVAVPEITATTLAEWARRHPRWVPVLGLAVGLSQERLRNALRHHFDTTGWVSLARERPAEVIAMLNERYELVRLVAEQRGKVYNFGDILAARAGSRATATRAGAAGRRVEDEIQAVAERLELPYQLRTRFTGRNGRTAACDLVIPHGDAAAIAVAAKGFDSTGSKLTDAVREIEEMAEVRLPSQFILAVVDGIGWKNRQADLRRIYQLRERQQVDGMYTLAMLDDFESAIRRAAQIRGVSPSL
jgi:hypothetical protein